MTADIRLSTDLFKNKKIWTLERRLGSKAVFSLIRLWFWTAQCRPDGRLGAAEEDFIAYVAEWKGNGAHFVQALTDLALLDKDADGAFFVHNWQKRQPYASYLWERSHAQQKPCPEPWTGSRTSGRPSETHPSAHRSYAGTAAADKAAFGGRTDHARSSSARQDRHAPRFSGQEPAETGRRFSSAAFSCQNDKTYSAGPSAKNRPAGRRPHPAKTPVQEQDLSPAACQNEAAPKPQAAERESLQVQDSPAKAARDNSVQDDSRQNSAAADAAAKSLF